MTKYTQKQGTTQMRQLQQKQPFHFTFHFELACILINMSKYNIFIVLIVCVVFFFVLLHSFTVFLQLNFWEEEGKNKRHTYFQRIKQEEKSSRCLPSLSFVYLIRQRPYGPKTINNGTVHRLIPQAKMCAFFFLSLSLVFFFIVLSVSITKLLLQIHVIHLQLENSMHEILLCNIYEI